MHTKDTDELLSEIRDKQNIKQFLAEENAIRMQNNGIGNKGLFRIPRKVACQSEIRLVSMFQGERYIPLEKDSRTG